MFGNRTAQPYKDPPHRPMRTTPCTQQVYSAHHPTPPLTLPTEYPYPNISNKTNPHARPHTHTHQRTPSL